MPKQISINGSEDEQPITISDLGSIISRYREERLQVLPVDLSEDSTSVWISKDKLTEFFGNNPDANGIRFYYGVIDDPYILTGVHNLVLVSTKDDKVDQVGDNDWVLITQNVLVVPVEGTLDAVICPPPLDKCNGREFE